MMDLNNMNLENALEAVTQIVTIAGHSVIQEMKHYPIEVKRKEDGSIQTNLDLLSEKLIIEQLSKLFPEFGYLSEERGSGGAKDVRWIIDPIDDTEKLKRGMQGWSIIVALQIFCEIVLGVIYDPVQKSMFTAIRKRGAYHNGRRIQVSRVDSMKNAHFCHSGLKQLAQSSYWNSFKTLLEEVDSENGAGGYQGWMNIAAGKADLGLHCWLGPEDIAAASIIIKEAGGKVTGLDGKFNLESDPVLVSNGLLHQDALKAIRA